MGEKVEQMPRPTADCGVSGGVVGFLSAWRGILSEQEGAFLVGDPEEPRRAIVITLGFVGLWVTVVTCWIELP